MRDHHATYTAAMRETSPQPTVLIAIETGDATTPWIRLTSNETATTYDSNTFTPRPFEFGAFEVAGGGERSLQLKLADVDGYFSTWLATTDFRWKTVKRYLIDRGVADKAQLDTFRIVNRTRGDREFIFTVEPRMAILARVRLPAEVLTREEFPGIPDEGVIG